MTVQEYFAGLADCAARVDVGMDLTDALTQAVSWLDDVRTVKGTVHLVGNGGSLDIVRHAQTDLVKACRMRAQIPGAGTLTAYGNDEGYPRSFARPLAIWIDEDDALIAVSSSGLSENILAAADLAKDVGATVLTFTGFSPSNPLRGKGDLNFYVPSSTYGEVELTHAALLHYLTDRLAHVG